MSLSAANLRIEEVFKSRRGNGGQKVEILKGVSFSVPAGELTAICGPSGGGKSTLIRLLNRLEDPDSGRILLNGEDIFDADPLQLRTRVGLVSQKPFMFAGTVAFNLERPFSLQEKEAPQGDFMAEAVELCGLTPEILGQDARSLSLGQQQRVSLARMLVSEPEVLLLDEPTSALDRPTGDRLASTLKEICRLRKMTILMVTHDLRITQRVADRLVYLEDGRVFEEGPAEELFSSPRSTQLKNFLVEPAEEVS